MDQEVIYKALRGEATPDELEQVARWHSENPEDFQRCADEVHMQIDMMELYGEEIRPASWIAVHWRKVVRITVQAAAMLAIGLFVGGYISKERTYDMLAEQINTLQVPYGQRLKFTLPDGSSVQLNSGAKIEYPSVFKKNLRRVKLSGEAVFDVEHDEKFERAFDVKIDISLEKLPNIRNVSGKIRVNDGIDKALHILQYTADFSYKKNSETNVVTIY